MNSKLLVFVLIVVAFMLVYDFNGAGLASDQGSGLTLRESQLGSTLNFTALQLPSFANNLTGSGAYERLDSGPWFKISSVGASGIANTTDAPMEGANYGVEGGSYTNTHLNTAQVQVSFSQLTGSESDSSYGKNAWSVQLNTNFFVGNNYQGDWVQFVLQNNIYNISSSQRFTRFGVWWGVNVYGAVWFTQNSTYFPIQTLATGVNYDILGTIASNGELEGELDISSPSGNLYYFVYEPDTYGLAGKWWASSGTILGGALGSTADFNHPSAEDVTVMITANNLVGPYAYSDNTTGEMNNLNLKSTGTTLLGNSFYVTTQSSY